MLSRPEHRVLITGGNGFVGSALVDALQTRTEVQLRLAVRHSGLMRGSVKAEEACIGSLENPSLDWSPAVPNVQIVVHLAARVHTMRESGDDAMRRYRSANVLATVALAQAAARAGARRFVYVSSAKVIGETTPAGMPACERHAGIPTDPYGRSKLEAEIALREISSHTGMELVIIRPPLVYGPGVKANFASLMRAVARGIPLPVGAINNRRSLVALDNLIDFIMICMTHPAAAGETFFVSDGEDLSTPELVHRLSAAMGVRAHIIPVPTSVLMLGARLVGCRSTVERLCGNLQLDIRKAGRVLGWTPPLTVDDALLRAVRKATR